MVSVLTVDFGLAITFSPDPMIVLHLIYAQIMLVISGPFCWCIGSQNHAGNPRRLNYRNRTELGLDDIAAHRRWSALDPTRTRAARPFQVFVLWGEARWVGPRESLGDIR